MTRRMGLIAVGLLAAACGPSSSGETRQSGTTPAAQEHSSTGAGVTPEQNDAIDRLFRRKAQELQSCWQAQYEKTKDRKLEGDVIVGLTVQPSGKPVNVRVLQSSLNTPDIEKCVVTAVAAWNFPEVSADFHLERTIHLGAQF